VISRKLQPFGATIMWQWVAPIVSPQLFTSCTQCTNICLDLMFMGPCIVIIFWYIIPTRCTSHRVYFIWQLLYMFRALLSPIFRSTKQLHLQYLVAITPCCCLLLSWKLGTEQFKLFHDSSRQWTEQFQLFHDSSRQ